MTTEVPVGYRFKEADMRRAAAVVLFVIGVAVMVTTLRAGAAQAPDLAPLVKQYWHAWDQGPDAAARLYAKDPTLVFYDLEPLKYTGWTEYQTGVVPNILAKFDTVKFTVNDDVKATRRGEVGWTTATVRGDGTLKGGAPVHVVIRHTAIWEKRGNDWLIVHEHVSVPSTLPAPPKAAASGR
jgi:ketosteroid isomerase-like protein